jgi:hypothetical protein
MGRSQWLVESLPAQQTLVCSRQTQRCPDCVHRRCWPLRVARSMSRAAVEPVGSGVAAWWCMRCAWKSQETRRLLQEGEYRGGCPAVGA